MFRLRKKIRKRTVLLSLSIADLTKKPLRTAGLFISAAVLSFTVFGGLIFSSSLNNGLKSVRSQFGADIMAVPADSDKSVESVLLTGEKSYFYLDKSEAEKIKNVEGVGKVTTQFYLASIGAACCDSEVEIIGYDPKTDFVITPWIKENKTTEPKRDELIVGSEVYTEKDGTIKLFNSKYKVAAHLKKTGTGLDCAVIGTTQTTEDLFNAAKKEGLNFTKKTDPKNKISSILIDTKDGYTKDDVVHNIRVSVDGLKLSQSKNLIDGISSDIGKISGVINIFTVILFIILVVMLAVIFSLILGERRKDFAVMRILGFDKSKITRLFISENLIVNILGGLTGIIVCYLIAILFSGLISDKISLPYLMPNFGKAVLYALVSLVAEAAVVILASVVSVAETGNKDDFLILREGEQ